MDYLFDSKEFKDYLGDLRNKIIRNGIYNPNNEDIEVLFKRYFFKKLSIDEDKMRIIGNSKKTSNMSMRTIVRIPYTGSGDLFNYHTSPCYPASSAKIIGHADLRKNTLDIEIIANANNSAEDNKRLLNQKISRLKEYINWVNDDIINVNNSIKSLILSNIKSKKEHVKKTERFANSFGLPVEKQ